MDENTSLYKPLFVLISRQSKLVFHFLMVFLLINLTQCKYGLDTLTRLVQYYLYSIQTETELNVMSKVHVKFDVSTKILPLVTKKKKKNQNCSAILLLFFLHSCCLCSCCRLYLHATVTLSTCNWN